MIVKRISFIFLFFVFLTLFPYKVFAGDVVINEFLVDPESEQWVELYNKETSVIDISGWFIDDDGGTQKYTIPSGTILNPGDFKVFESSYFNLNRTSEDTVRLLNGATEEDSYTYSSGPGTHNSYGRTVDGTGAWVIFNTPTKGSSNNTATPVPTFTSTPTVTPTITHSPTPTKTPTPQSTQKPTATSTVKPTATIKPTQNSLVTTSVTKKPSPTEITNDTMPTAVLGESISKAISPSPTGMVSVKDASQKGILGIIAGIGIVFVFISGILTIRNYVQNKKSIHE